MKAKGALVLVAALFVGPQAVAQEAGSIDISGGVFTQQQADRGERWYRGMCTRCHGIELVSPITEVPSLTGIAFEVNWLGRSVGDLYDTIRYTMPAISRQTMPFERPNTRDYMSEELVSDLVAYILSFNGYPDGTAELSPDAGTLAAIAITPDGRR